MNPARSATALLVLLAMVGATSAKPAPKAASKALPKQFLDVKALKIGDPIASFMANFSAEEKETTVRGLRIFAVRVNTLPSGLTAVRCDFLDGRLAYIQGQLDSKMYSEPSWTSFIGPRIAQYGTPQTPTALLGINRLHGVRLGESAGAAWADRSVAIIYGRQKRDSAREPSSPPSYVVALADAKYVAQVGDALKAEEADEIAAEQAAQRKREADAAEVKRQQEEKVAEAKRVQDAKDAEARRLLAEKDAEAKRLREEAERAKQTSDAEAKRLQAVAEKAQKDLQEMKAQTEREQARKAAEEERARVKREATAKIKATAAAVSCGCISGGKIQIRCHVRSDADVAAVATVIASGNGRFDTGFFGGNGNRRGAGTQSIALQPITDNYVEITAALDDPLGDLCEDTSACECSVSAVVVR